MLRVSRRLTTALLWIAIALLPVRGAVAAVMPVVMPDVSSSAAAQPADHAAPCHGSASDEAPAGAAHGCPMCELCHASVVHASALPIVLPEWPEALPHAAPPHAIEPRAPDGLFRPPRPTLA